MNDITSSPGTVRFPVAGMTCGPCVLRIVRAIRKLDGVTMVDVDLRRKTATVRREPALVSNAALAAAVAAAGYQANPTAITVIPTRQARRRLYRIPRRSR